MKIITQKTINPIIVSIALYLSFCLSGFYLGRGEWGYTITGLFSLTGTTSVASSVFVAFFACGIVPFFIYELVTSFSFKMIRQKLGYTSEDMRYALRFFYICANLVIAIFSLVYLISPLISIYGSIFIPFLVMVLFFILYILFIFKHYVKKHERALALMQFGGVFVIFYAITAALELLTAVGL